MNQTPDAIDERVGVILFTDLVGFTEFTDSVGDVAALAILDTQRDLVERVLHGLDDARVVKELGDGLMLWFGSATMGLRCAVQLLALVEEARSAQVFPLAVRMGMHYGSALVRGDDLIGQTVNIAARVSDLAGPGELLVSDEAIEALGPSREDFDMRAVGPVRVKGVQIPVWLHRIAI